MHPIILSIVTRPLINFSSVEVVDLVHLAETNKAYIQLRPLGQVRCARRLIFVLIYNKARRLKYAALILSGISGYQVTVAAIPPVLSQVTARRNSESIYSSI